MPAVARPPVVMGHVLGAFGVRGWVRIQPYTEEPDGLARYPKWWLGKAGDWREVAVAEAAPHGSLMVARFEGCASPEEAAKFRGCEIGVPRESLPSPGEGEVYQADLLGLKVVNRSGEVLGLVEGVLDSGAHPVIRVRHEGGERLLPYVAAVVEQVDLQAGEIRVDWGADW